MKSKLPFLSLAVGLLLMGWSVVGLSAGAASASDGCEPTPLHPCTGTVTVTVPGTTQVVTETVTLPGVTETVTLPGHTVTLPAETVVVTLTERGITTTLPAETVTVTQIVNVPVRGQTETVTDTETVTETVQASGGGGGGGDQEKPSLPLTGLPLIPLMIGGVLLVLIGAYLRRDIFKRGWGD